MTQTAPHIDADASVGAALRRHLEALTVEIGPRSPFLGDNLARAERYVRGSLEASGLVVTEQVYSFRGTRVANLIASTPGSAGATAYYVVGAHYDSVASTPGADDNGSAVAVLLELARALPSLQVTVPVHLVAFTMEEPPAFMTSNQGSRVYVRERRRAGDRIAGAVVLEMVGYTSPAQRYPLPLRWAGYPKAGNFVGIVGNARSRAFGRCLLQAFRRNERLPVESLFAPLNGWILPSTRLSDHSSFWDARVPAVMITDTAFLRNPNYHLPSDTIDTLDFDYMSQLVVSLGLALQELPPVQAGPG